MGCYCGATMAPCSWCEDSYECSGCWLIRNKDDDGINFLEEDIFCDKCVNIGSEAMPVGDNAKLDIWAKFNLSPPFGLKGGTIISHKGPIKINIKMVSGNYKPKECECGKEKHGFSTHSDWCPKYDLHN